MTNRQSRLLAVVVCTAAFSSAGALAYTLNRPVVIPSRPELGQLAEREPTALTASAPEPGDVLDMTPIVVMGHAAPRAAARADSHLPARDLRDMRCTGWRPLEQGSVTQGVRLCE